MSVGNVSTLGKISGNYLFIFFQLH